MSLRLVNKKGNARQSFMDSAIFHSGKGCDKDGRPYGIVRSQYQDPFSMRFDKTSLTAYLNPGIFEIYGRDIVLDAEQLVYDFHSTSESSVMFCTVYISINLEDSTRQSVSVGIDISGGNFKNFATSGIQDNLIHLTHGVFQAPVCRFKYTPSSNEPFSDYSVVASVLDDESRFAVRNLRKGDTINGTLVESLFQVNKAAKASNSESLAIYKASGSGGKNVKGYSHAVVANSFGTNAIDSSLTGLYTVKRVKLCDIDGNFMGSDCNIVKDIRVDWNHLDRVIMFFSHAKLKGHGEYYERGIATFGIQNWAKGDCSVDFDLADYEINSSKLVSDGLSVYLRGTFEAIGNPVMSSLGFKPYANSANDGFLSIYIRLASYQVSQHDFGAISIAKLNERFARFTAKGNGNSEVYCQWYQFLDWRWFQYMALSNIEASGEVYADFIYKGGVDLS